MPSVIFDLDGTLADTSGDLIAAANACFNAMGQADMLSPDADQLTAFEGGRAMLRLGFSRLGTAWDAADIDRQYPALLAYYGEHIDRYTRLYDGALGMLGQLRDAGYRLGVCTNKPEALAETLLRRLGVRGYFGALLGADSLAFRKPDPRHLLETIARLGGRAETSVLVGDTLTDRDTARRANVPGILVTFGPRARDVAALEPDALLEHFDDLPALLSKMNR